MRAESKQRVLLDSLTRFYDVPEHFQELQNVVVMQRGISLRTLDWLVTNYAKKTNLVLVSNQHGKPFVNVFIEYKSQLKGHQKRNFDPFCRRNRVCFCGIETTLGQLNFFRWAIQNGVLEYGKQHVQEIEADMLEALRHRFESSARDDAGENDDVVSANGDDDSRRRKELSRAAVRACTKTTMAMKLHFE